MLNNWFDVLHIKESDGMKFDLINGSAGLGGPKDNMCSPTS